jgi:gliding motility-associated-like protein
MRYLIFVVLLIGSSRLAGQSFEEKQRFLLPMYDELVKLQWADINNDSLLDAVIGYKKMGEFKVVAFQNGNIEPWPAHEIISVQAMDDISFQFSDVDKNGALDLVVENSQQYLALTFLNSGDFNFEEHSGWGSREIFLRGLQYVDLNNDTAADTIWTEGTMLGIMNSRDTILNKIASFQVVDLDNNGFRDVVFSGVDFQNKPLTYAWYFGNNFQVIHRIKLDSLCGRLAIGDLDQDGYFDVLITGKDKSGSLKTRFLKNNLNGFSEMGHTTGLDSAEVLIADFTSDGLADIAFFGKDKNGERLNWISTLQGDSVALADSISIQSFGDFDRDGDLDWGFVHNDSLYVFNNSADANKGPSRPVDAIALSIFNKTFVYWVRSADEHTAMDAITYDLRVFTSETTLVAPGFDPVHRHRTLVAHGNMGLRNFAVLDIQEVFNFEIQAIDNALVPDAKSICSGVVSVCANIETTDITSCGDEPVLLTASSPDAMWFSVSKGFLGAGSSYTITGTVSDSIFYFVPNGLSCANVKQFNVQVSPNTSINIEHIRYDCENRNITLEVGEEWNSVQWTNNLNASMINTLSIVHTFEQSVIFTATASNEFGCTLNETFDLRLSKPDLQLNGTHFRISKGSTVQLIASGANSYEWTPSGTLSNNLIFNPIASPIANTEYTVTALDSLGCSSVGYVLVEVSEQAYIPTLFTPNGDNKNDNLRIYGLTQASGFRFVIYNREGATLYETTSVAEATQSGWSGQVSGLVQPPGTYYWKIAGEIPNGELMLNGKKNGAFLLIR